MQFRKKLLPVAIAAAAMGLSGIAQASAFQLFEQNAAGTGDYHAGGAAEANNATTSFYNPAGLVRLHHQQVVVGSALILTNIKFKGTVAGTQGTAQGGISAVVPNFAYAAPISNRVTFGFTIDTPFGLATSYSSASNAASVGTLTSIRTVDISPALGIALTKKLSIGFGPDALYMTGEFDNWVLDSLPDENTATAWGYGYHAGVLYQFTPNTRLGVSYHSGFTLHATGKSKITVPGTPPTVITNRNAKVKVPLPAYTMISLFHRFNKQWAAMGTVEYTQWSVFRNLTLKNVAVPAGFGFPTTINIPQNFHNTWNFAVGGLYSPCPKWTFKTGLGYDETPTTSTARNLRLPDENRIAIAFGAHYQASKSIGLDVGWTHLFIQNAKLNNTLVIPTSVTTLGTAKSSADVIAAQLTWTIT